MCESNRRLRNRPVAAETVGARMTKHRKALSSSLIELELSAGTIATLVDRRCGVSRSGRSGNLLRAVAVAREIGVTSGVITGASENPLAEAADIAIRAPGSDTAAIQELHTVITHLICELVEELLTD